MINVSFISRLGFVKSRASDERGISKRNENMTTQTGKQCTDLQQLALPLDGAALLRAVGENGENVERE